MSAKSSTTCTEVMRVRVRNKETAVFPVHEAEM